MRSPFFASNLIACIGTFASVSVSVDFPLFNILYIQRANKLKQTHNVDKQSLIVRFMVLYVTSHRIVHGLKDAWPGILV